jgi:hypothetical protein
MKKSFLSSFGIFCLRIAAICIFETSINQRSSELISQSIHFDRFTINIFEVFITSKISKLDFICHIIFLIIVFVINQPNFAAK